MLTNSSSSAQPLCHEGESSSLLQFKHSFLINKFDCSSSIAFLLTSLLQVIVQLVQRLNHGRSSKEKAVTVAHGMASSVTTTMVMWLASTSAAVFSTVLSTSIVASSTCWSTSISLEML
ncbi:hypothetical protein CsSME_00019044 [Camellia sinensis var. sinensis]